MAIEQQTETSSKAKPALQPQLGSLTVLRPITRADLPLLAAWDEDPEIIALMGRRFSEQPLEDWFKAVRSGQVCRAMAIETLEGQLIGEVELAQLNRRTGSTELRICIGEKGYWGRGYGSDAFGVLLRVAFEDFGMRQVYLRVFTTNTRAIQLYLRAGFRREAILEPSSRRGDPSAVLLMNLTRERWLRRLQIQPA